MAMHVTALFKDRFTAHAAVEQLAQAGFSRDDLSLLMSEATHGYEFSAVPSGVTVGHSVLAAVAASVEPLPLRSPAGSPLVAAGPLAASLALGDTARTVAGALVAAGLAPDEARATSEKLDHGGILVGVEAGSRATLVRELLQLSGGEALRAA